MEGAVAAVRSRGDIATADLWQEALDNLTTGTPGRFLLPDPLLLLCAACCAWYKYLAAVQLPSCSCLLHRGCTCCGVLAMQHK